MSITVIDTDNDDSETEEAVEEVAEALDDAVMDATTISLVERVTRVEDALQVQAAAIEGITERISSLTFTDEMHATEIQETREAVNIVAEQQEEIAEGAAEAVQEVVEDIDQASEEIKPDELPTVREHWFFKRWGKR